MNVLVIPEDFRKDQYMLKPVIAAMLNWIGVTARVEVCQDPLLGGVTEALKWERIVDIIGQYSWKVQLFLLCVDRDGNAHRRSALDSLEREAAKVLKPDRRFLAENAWQEIEVWVLAGHDLPAEWEWAASRAERDAKETYYLPFARSRGMFDTPGEGRRRLAKEAAQRYSRMRQLCPEDVGALEVRIREQLGWESAAS